MSKKKKIKKPMGRTKKYGEETDIICFRVPKSKKETLRKKTQEFVDKTINK